MSTDTLSHRESAQRDLAAGDKHCVFCIGANWFSIPATAVQEITLASEIVRVPGSHSLLAGLCHVRSEFVPVVQLNALLQEAVIDTGDDKKLLVIEGTGGNWALLIDNVVALESLETLIHPEQRSDVSPSPILGTATYRDQIVRVLDPNGIFRLSHESLQESWSALNESRHQPRSTARSES